MQTPPIPESPLSRWASDAWQIVEGCQRFAIVGRTHSGATFRPSDWGERLAGVMSQYRPARAGANRRLTYSPYVVPSDQDGARCVVVDKQLRDIEPRALSFLVNFAIDNELQIVPLD